MRVLVVDDDDGFRAYLRTLLETDELNYSVVGEAADGDEAIRLALELQPDAILIDFQMPRLDGAAAALTIHKHLPQVKIVMLSGTDRSGDAADRAQVALLRKTALEIDALRAVLEST